MSQFTHYTTTLATTLEKATDLDLLTAYYLGMKAVAPPTCPELLALETKVEMLFLKKRGLKFLDRALVVSGSNNMTPEMKEKVLTQEKPLETIAALNEISGKVEGTLKLKPFEERLTSPDFHQEFLDYEAEAHHQVVGALIERLEPVVEKIRVQSASVSPSKKNTLKNLYDGRNQGILFVSLDLKQANWTALRYWDSSLPTWDEFMHKYLPEGPLKALFAVSKNFRQVTIGVALKKHNAVKLVENTQVMLIREQSQSLIKRLGEPFSESNDEAIFKVQKKDLAWLQQTITDPRFRLTSFQMKKKTYDDCYLISYEDLETQRRYTLLRCATPDKIEARLK
jgi:DNA-directed RNA polymerase subunit F